MQLIAYELCDNIFRTKPMSLKHAILSMVISQPKSGYDIAKEFSGSVNFYWGASHQQIYKTLAELENNQWLAVEGIAQLGKPNKKNYSITAKGREELLLWVEQPSKKPSAKNILLVKLLTLEEVGKDVLIKVLNDHQLKAEQNLKTYQNIEEEFFSNGVEDIKELYYVSKYLSLRYGINHAKGELLWLEETLQVLEGRK